MNEIGIMHVRLFTQEIVLGLLFMTLALMVAAVRIKAAHWKDLAPAFSWVGHAIIFYTVVSIRPDQTPSSFFTLWSSVLRLHGVFMFLGVMLILVGFKAWTHSPSSQQHS